MYGFSQNTSRTGVGEGTRAHPAKAEWALVPSLPRRSPEKAEYFTKKNPRLFPQSNCLLLRLVFIALPAFGAFPSP